MKMLTICDVTKWLHSFNQGNRYIMKSFGKIFKWALLHKLIEGIRQAQQDYFNNYRCSFVSSGFYPIRNICREKVNLTNVWKPERECSNYLERPVFHSGRYLTALQVWKRGKRSERCFSQHNFSHCNNCYNISLIKWLGVPRDNYNNNNSLHKRNATSSSVWL